MVETIITLLSNYPPIKNKRLKIKKRKGPSLSRAEGTVKRMVVEKKKKVVDTDLR